MASQPVAERQCRQHWRGRYWHNKPIGDFYGKRRETDQKPLAHEYAWKLPNYATSHTSQFWADR